MRFLSAAIMAALVLVSATLLACGGPSVQCPKPLRCDDHLPIKPVEAAPAFTQHRLRLGVSAYEFHLQDGTRCVTIGTQGITCDWRH